MKNEMINRRPAMRRLGAWAGEAMRICCECLPATKKALYAEARTVSEGEDYLCFEHAKKRAELRSEK